MSTASVLREQIAGLVREYYQQQFANRTFTAGTDLVHYAGRVFDDEELRNLVDASLDFFRTANRYSHRFESDFADYLGLSHARVQFTAMCRSARSGGRLRDSSPPSTAFQGRPAC